MAVSEIPGSFEFLTNAAHLLRMTAPETSAHLMSHRDNLLSQHRIPLSDLQRQQVCGGCGLIRIPGEETSLRFDTRKNIRRKTKREKSTTIAAPKLTQELQGPCKVFHCRNCYQDTKIYMPAPGPSIRHKVAKPSKVKKPAATLEATKPTANATSKKRAKNRKAGLQALLSGQKQQAANPLSLAHFMK